MAFRKINTGKKITTQEVLTIEECDICGKEMKGIYPNFGVEVSMYPMPSYPNDGQETAWFHSICSSACLRKVADKFESE